MDWPAENISRIIAGLELDFRGGVEMPDIAPKGDPGRVEMRQGNRCLVGGYFQFDVDDSYIYDTDEPVVLNLLFDTSVGDSFVVTYDAAIGPKAVKHHFPKEQEHWQWARLTLDRSRFANRRHGVDFGVASLASQMAGVEYEADAMGTKDAQSEDRIVSDHNIALCGMRIERPSIPQETTATGKLALTVRDDSGEPTAARLGLYNSETDWAPKANSDAIRMRLLGLEHDELYLIDGQEKWPGLGRYVFFVDGEYFAELPVGTYQVVVSKGPEYKFSINTVSVRADRSASLEIDLDWWVNMAETGWYSGDIHVHLERRDRRDDKWILQLADAEDVAVTSLLAETGWAVPHFFANYAYGDELGGRVYSDDREHVIVSGQESPVTQELGHAIGINQTSPVRSADYYSYQDFIEGIHHKGGLFGFSHLQYYPLLNVHRGMALEIPFGHVDFAEILQAGVLDTKIWYDFLNMGFKVTPAAGTDFPFLNMWGSERTYAKIDGDLNHQSWFYALARGNVFVTSGPMLTLDVNGRSMGDTIKISAGEEVRIKASAAVDIEIDEIERLELVVHGGVVATGTRNHDGTFSLTHTIAPTQSAWLAVRAYGQRGNATEAHSAPVYIHVDDDTFFAKKTP